MKPVNRAVPNRQGLQALQEPGMKPVNLAVPSRQGLQALQEPGMNAVLIKSLPGCLAARDLKPSINQV